MNKNNNHASGRISMCNLSSLNLFAIFIAVSSFLFCAGQCSGQSVPLADLVPLQELEVRTNDLIQIATAYSEGQRDLKIAQLNLETLTSLSASTVVSQLEMRVARLNVAAAERKVAIFRAIAERQLAATQAKLEILEQMDKVGQNNEKSGITRATSQNRISIAQVRAMVNILQMILEPLPTK